MDLPTAGDDCMSNGAQEHLTDSDDAYRKSVYPIPFIQLEIDDTHAVEGAKQLLRHIRPQWPSNSIKFTVFTAGLTNKLIGCSLGQSETGDTVLVRIYGRRTDLMINREQERNSMVVLHTIGCAAPVYCRFKNGMAYGFLPGIVLDIDLARRPHVQRLIAGELARVHSVDTDALAAKFDNGLHFEKRPSLFTTMYKWLEHVPESFTDASKQTELNKFGMSQQQLKSEIDCLHDALVPLRSPVVLCHNDLLLKNIVYNEEKQKVSFIDFEYVAYNYQAFDIANHFCEYAGMEEVDFTLYPDRQYQLAWLRGFLECSFKQDGRSVSDITNEDVERLYVQVNKFSLAAHIFWALWALIQSRFSVIDFDYIHFARLRLDEYWTRKDEFLSLQLP